jgi:hydrogenase maturation protein HypF
MAQVSQGVSGSAANQSTNGRERAHNVRSARRLILTGGVQGLGIRPAIFRLANELHLAGTVRNSSCGVEIEIEGPPQALLKFQQSLPQALPKAATLLHLCDKEIAASGRTGFSILHDSSDGPLLTRVPQDRAMCADCLNDVNTPGNRRRGYAFTSCTLCGPRYTIIREMPFERCDTSMDKFPRCEDCDREFKRPSDRRFHAQTIACQSCGPQVWSQRPGTKERMHGVEALRAVIAEISAGRIVALRGLGGYQLLADATNEAAVTRLRDRKRRPAKPLAVMVREPDVARRLAYLGDAEIDAIFGPEGPIVLAHARPDNRLAKPVHPQLDTIGLMAPTTPLHAILAHNCGPPLVCTSGNLEGDPLEFEPKAAERALFEIADLWLHHDREIIQPIDDSVIRIIAGRRVTIRAARGLAPLPLELPTMRPTIALGGYLKAAAAWSNGGQSVLGPHVGDQQGLAARGRFIHHLQEMQHLYGFRPELFVHDMHPEYFSSQWVLKQGTNTLAVQHHHAHVTAGMLEHGWLDRKVIGIAWDGTGYGADGTVWGGEFLVSTAARFERAARLRPFRLPGGEAAIQEPWRIAASIVAQLGTRADFKRPGGWKVDSKQMESVLRILNRPQFSPLTSSAGRLIDAAAALILGIERADFDGQAAMRLEASADRDAHGWYDFPLSESELPELDWRPLFAGLMQDIGRGVDPDTLSMRFHRSLAHGITRVCRHWREMPAVLCGGVFQNRLLTELVVEMHNDKMQQLGLPGVIPPNDGGLAAGQLAVAAAHEGLIACA